LEDNALFHIGQLQFYIFNEIGKLVLNPTLTKEVKTIDLSQLEKGVYYIQIKGDRLNATQKIIKQ